MKFYSSSVLPEVIHIEPDIYSDSRGHFLETYQAKKYLEHGIPATFVQDNLSFSKQGVLRGLHYQLKQIQGKLVWAIQGEILDVAVDIRKGSPTFGKWISVTLSSEKHNQLFIPEGFAHGFCVQSETAWFCYKCTDYYDPSSERGVIWDDPILDIDWNMTNPVISEKDNQFPGIADLTEKDLPSYS